jgi:hypothetical protein
MQMSPEDGGSTVPSSGWQNAGVAVEISAVANPSFNFVAWSGSGPGSYSGLMNPAVVVMIGPIIETATFQSPTSTTTSTSSPTQTTWTTTTPLEETTTSASSIVEGTTSSEQPTIPVSSPARCIIATAAYGSEMAPEVVYMRYVRDRLIGSTAVGRALVGTFNAFYYSWSPRLAESISANQFLRVVFPVLLLPLVGIVHAAALAFTIVASMTGNADAASVIAFLAAAAMALAIYVALPVLGVVKLRHVIRASRIWRRT